MDSMGGNKNCPCLMNESMPLWKPLIRGRLKEQPGGSAQSEMDEHQRWRKRFRGTGLVGGSSFTIERSCQWAWIAVQTKRPAGWLRLSSVLERTQTVTSGKTRLTKLLATPRKRHSVRTCGTVSSCWWKGQRPPSFSQELSLDPTCSLRHSASQRNSRNLVGQVIFRKAVQTSGGCRGLICSDVARC